MRRTAETDDMSRRKWAKRILLILIAGLYALYTINADRGEDHPILFLLEAGACLYGYFAKLKPFLKDKYTAALREADELDAKGSAYLTDHNAELSLIPDEYWYPRATGYIFRLAETGRIETINQGLQMLDEQIHRWSVEDANEQIVAEQQAQSRSLRSIAVSSAINAFVNTTRD